MAGLKGFVREPKGDARARRNSQGLATTASFVGAGSVVILDANGILQIDLAASSGLQNVAGELALDLITNSGLILSAAGVGIQLVANSGLTLTSGGLGVDLRDTEPGLELVASGIGLLLATDPGLEFSTGVRVKLNGGTLARAAGGLSVVTTALDAATTVAKGIVNQAAVVADLNQTISVAYTQPEVQAISDKVDELLASLRTAGLLAT